MLASQEDRRAERSSAHPEARKLPTGERPNVVEQRDGALHGKKEQNKSYIGMVGLAGCCGVN